MPPLNEQQVRGAAAADGDAENRCRRRSLPQPVIPYSVEPLSVKPATGLCPVPPLKEYRHRGSAIAAGDAENDALASRFTRAAIRVVPYSVEPTERQTASGFSPLGPLNETEGRERLGVDRSCT